jgi:uncharacterized protein YjbI with pentapeptide repeats
LRYSDFSNADLTGASLRHVRFGRTTLYAIQREGAAIPSLEGILPLDPDRRTAETWFQRPRAALDFSNTQAGRRRLARANEM